MLDEASEGRRRPGRHHLDAIRNAHVTNHPDLGHLVLLRLAVRHDRRRRRREQVSRIGRAPVVEYKRRLLRCKAHARLFRLKDLVEHPGGANRGVEVRDAAVLIDAERVEVVAEVMRGHVLGAEINAFARDSINAVGNRLSELVRDNALVVIIGLGSERIRIPDARAGDHLNFQLVPDSPNRKPAIAIDRTLFARELHELLERVSAGHVAPLAPLVEELGHNLVVVAVPGRRRILIRREVVPELARDLARLGKVLHEVARFPHHHDTRARGLRRFARLTVGLRRVKPIRLRGVVAEKRSLDSRLQTLPAPGRRHRLNRFVEPRARRDDFCRVEGFHDRRINSR